MSDYQKTAVKRGAERIGRGCVKKREKMENKPSWKKRKKGAFWACAKGLRGGDLFRTAFWGGGGAEFAGGFFWRGEDFSLGFSGWFGWGAVREEVVVVVLRDSDD